MTLPALVPMDPIGPDTAPETYWLPPEKLITGNPRQSLWPAYTNEAKQFFTGVWRSEPGKWRVEYTEDEYCEILAGLSIITDAAGHATTVQAGHRFVLPRGFVGTWEVVVTTRKLYVIHEVSP